MIDRVYWSMDLIRPAHSTSTMNDRYKYFKRNECIAGWIGGRGAVSEIRGRKHINAILGITNGAFDMCFFRSFGDRLHFASSLASVACAACELSACDN